MQVLLSTSKLKSKLSSNATMLNLLDKRNVTNLIKHTGEYIMTTFNNAQTLVQFFESVQNPTYRLEGFCFTYDVGLNFYFDNVNEFKDIIDNNDLEIEFWQLEYIATKTEYSVTYFSELEAIIEWLEGGENSDMIQQYINLANDNFCELKDAKDYHENNLFSEYMENTELGYYVIDEGFFGVEIPDSLANYLDYEAIGRDFSFDLSECGGYYYNNF